MAQLIHNPAPGGADAKGMNEIIPNLWLGDILSTYNIERIQEKRITKVISLIDQPLPQWLRTQYSQLGIRHMAFEVQDDQLEDILQIMAQVCDAIEENITGRSGVLVHCALGVSRSGSAVIAYVMRTHQTGRDKALEFVKRKRPRVQPNVGFWEQLEIWESCHYEVWEEVDGIRKEKKAYKDWRERSEEAMRERVVSLQ